MSTFGNIESTSIDNLIAEIGDRRYAIISLNLTAQINRVLTCQITLAQGKPLNKNTTRTASASNGFDSSKISAYTKVVVKLYIDGNKEPLVMFRGFVSSINSIAAKNAAGSYAGVILNCTAPPRVMNTYSANAYRYWGSKQDSKGRLQSVSNPNIARLLKELKMDFYATRYNPENDPFFRTRCAEFLSTTAGVLLETITDRGYPRDAVTVHFEYRDRLISVAEALELVNVNTDNLLAHTMANQAISSDILSTMQSTSNGLLLMHMVPLLCGKMDIKPIFPWSSDIIGLIPKQHILSIKPSEVFDPGVEAIDVVMVPVPYGTDQIVNATWVEYPNKDLPAAGVAKVVNMPQWLNPYAYEGTPESQPGATLTKTNKNEKKPASKIKSDAETFRNVAERLAQAYFVEIKNSGEAVEVIVPWHRLEFFDAVGYVMEIEQPIIGDGEARPNLFGMLSGVSLKLQSTPGGSTARTVLNFSHIRDQGQQEDLAFEDHPFYKVTGGPEQALKTFFEKTSRKYTRDKQIEFQGGNHETYLDDVITASQGKRIGSDSASRQAGNVSIVL